MSELSRKACALRLCISALSVENYLSGNSGDLETLSRAGRRVLQQSLYTYLPKRHGSRSSGLSKIRHNAPQVD